MFDALGRAAMGSDVRARVDALRSVCFSDAAWQERAVEVAEMTSVEDLFAGNPVLGRMRDIWDGWWDRAAGVRLSDRWPLLDGVDFDDVYGLELAEADADEMGGAISDYDPLNGVCFADVGVDSVFYTAIALPNVPMSAWPIFVCEPSGKENVEPDAMDAEHFAHEWFGKASWWLEDHAPGEEEEALVDLTVEAFGIRRHHAMAVVNSEDWQTDEERALQAELMDVAIHVATGQADMAVAEALKKRLKAARGPRPDDPYVDREAMEGLRAFVVLPEE